VGNNPYPVAPVRGVDGASWKYNRLRFVPFAFQVSQHAAERHFDEPNNVLKHDPSGPVSGNNSKSERPECAVICRAQSLPGARVGLAWDTGADNVCSGSSGNRGDVSIVRNSRPMFFQDPTAKRVDLREAHRFPAHPARGERKPADTGTQVEQLHGPSPSQTEAGNAGLMMALRIGGTSPCSSQWCDSIRQPSGVKNR